MTTDNLSEKSSRSSSRDPPFLVETWTCMPVVPGVWKQVPSSPVTQSLKSPGDSLDLTPDAAACSSASSVDQPNKQDIPKHFRYTNQEDAHEFLQHKVHTLHQSCLPESL